MNFDEAKSYLKENQKTWLVTGAAGFIASNIVEFLLEHDQKVVGVDNFSTGFQKNLDDIKKNVGTKFENFTFHELDLKNLEGCRKIFTSDINYICHQGALGSVPRSIEVPEISTEANVIGTLNVLVAAKEAGIKRIVYASSSSIYGDLQVSPKVEDNLGKCLSPYAVTKLTNEHYANVFGKCYGLECLGLRYFNVFGRRQDPEGAYAAVIPRWISKVLNNENIEIYGDGETSRDFCYIDNVIQANVLACLSLNPDSYNQAYNIACGARASLNDLANYLKEIFSESKFEKIYKEFRDGDVRHSLADISKANRLIGYKPEFQFKEGLQAAAKWYRENL